MNFSKSVPAIIIIIFSTLLTLLVLCINQQTWVSLLLLSFIGGGVIYLFFFKDYSLLFGILILVNHLGFASGANIARYLMIAAISILLPLLFFVRKPQNRKFFYFSTGAAILYYVVILVIRPFSLNSGWLLLHFESFLLFVISQLVTWDQSKIRRLVVINLFFLVLYGLFEFYFTKDSRIAGPMNSATAYGVMLNILWAIWFSMECFKPKPNRAMMLIVTVLSVLIMILTGTRMTIIGIFCTPFLIFIFKIFILKHDFFLKKIFLSVVYFILCTALFVMIWSFIPDELPIKSNFKSIENGEIDCSSMGRIIAWNVAFKAFKSNPVFGIGNGNFKSYMTDFFDQTGFSSEELGIPSLIHAHNLYLIILSENGLFGFLVISFIVIIALYSLFSHLKKNSESQCLYGLVVGFIIMMLLGLFDAVPFFPPTEAWGAWFLAAMIQLPHLIDKKIQ